MGNCSTGGLMCFVWNFVTNFQSSIIFDNWGFFVKKAHPTPPETWKKKYWNPPSPLFFKEKEKKRAHPSPHPEPDINF